MRIATVCEEGLKRSVAAQWLLQYRNNEVIAVGVKRLAPDTLAMLYDWAERIILLDGRYADGIPPEKLIVWDCGPDVFQAQHFDSRLVAMLKAYGKATEWPSEERAYAVPNA